MREFTPLSRMERGASARRLRAACPDVAALVLEPRLALAGFAATGPALAVADAPASRFTGGDQVLATWSTSAGEGSRTILARRYDLAGAPLGNEVQVTVAGLSSAAIAGASNAGGQTLLAWTVDDEPGALATGPSGVAGSEVRAQVFSASGLPMIPEMTLGRTQVGLAPVVSLAAGGDFVVGFTQIGGTASAPLQSPVARGYSAATGLLSDPIALDAATAGLSYRVTALGLDDLGRFVAGWTRTASGDGSATATGTELVLGRFDLVGRSLGGLEVITPRATDGSVTLTSLAVDPAGPFAFGYVDASAAEFSGFARRYNASGIFQGQNVITTRFGSFGTSTTVNNRAVGGRMAPGRLEQPVGLEVNASGGFATVAIQGNLDRSGTQVVRTFGADGKPLGLVSSPFDLSKYASVDPGVTGLGASATLLRDGQVLLIQGERSVPLSATATSAGAQGTIALQARVEVPEATPTTTAPAPTPAPAPSTPAQARAARRRARLQAAVEARAAARARPRATIAARMAAAAQRRAQG